MMRRVTPSNSPLIYRGALALYPQELAPFQKSQDFAWGFFGWLPRLLRAFPSAGLDKRVNSSYPAESRQAGIGQPRAT
jgi:hypothetical protein